MSNLYCTSDEAKFCMMWWREHRDQWQTGWWYYQALTIARMKQDFDAKVADSWCGPRRYAWDAVDDSGEHPRLLRGGVSTNDFVLLLRMMSVMVEQEPSAPPEGWDPELHVPDWQAGQKAPEERRARMVEV